MALTSSAREGEKPLIQTNTPIRALKFTQSHTQPCLFIKFMSMHLGWQKKKKKGNCIPISSQTVLYNSPSHEYI